MKSNNKNRYAALCLCAFTLLGVCASCDRNEAEADPVAGAPETACLEIDNIGVEGSVPSRAAVPTTGEIGFYRSTANSYTAVNNNKGVWKQSAVTGRNAWIPDPMIKVGTDDATLAVYYPYVAGNGNTLLLPAGQVGATVSGRTVQETWSKRFTYNSMSSYNAATVSQELKHVYARLQVKLSRGSGFIGTPDWTKIQLAGTGMCTTGNFNPLNNDVPSLTDYTHSAGTLTVTLGTVINFSGNTSTAADLLLIPNTLSGNLTVTITLGGKEMSVPVNTATAAGFNGQLLPGKQYNLTITVNATDLEIASLTTAAWSTVSLPGETTH